MNDALSPLVPIEPATRERPGLISRLRRLLRGNSESDLRESIEALVLAHEETSSTETDAPQTGLDRHERAIIANVLRLRAETVSDAMVPRADIVAVPEDMDLIALADLIRREGHSRYPVFQGTLDQVQGFIHIRDVFGVLGQDNSFSIASILRPVIFLAPSTPVLDALLEMRQKRTHIALVVDEYGGTDGLVTIEDLVEEIVGDIADEHDEPLPNQWTQRPDGSIEVDARLPIEQFEAQLGSFLTDEERNADIDTVGGLVFVLAGRIPARGEVVVHSSGIAFRVLDADRQRIRLLKVRLPEPQSRVLDAR